MLRCLLGFCVCAETVTASVLSASEPPLPPLIVTRRCWFECLLTARVL